MNKKIRFSEYRLGSDGGKALISNAKKVGYSDAQIQKAILACDVYIPVTSRAARGGSSSPLTLASDDIWDSNIDFTDNDNNTKSMGKDYDSATTRVYAQNLQRRFTNQRTDIWDMKLALTTGKTVKVPYIANDTEFEAKALENEAILIKTFLYLNGAGPKPAVMARPAFENNDTLVVSDEEMSQSDINIYFSTYFSYAAVAGMFDVISPYKGEKGQSKRKMDLKWAQKHNAEAQRIFGKEIMKRKANIAEVLGVSAEDLDIHWFFTLVTPFLLDGFWKVVSDFGGLPEREIEGSDVLSKKLNSLKSQIRKTNPNLSPEEVSEMAKNQLSDILIDLFTKKGLSQEDAEERVGEILDSPEVAVDDSDILDNESIKTNVDKGVLLDDKFVSFLNDPSSFDMNAKENDDTSLMNWIAYALKYRFSYYLKNIMYKAKKFWADKAAMSLSDENVKDDDKSGTSAVERAMYQAGAYTDSEEDAILDESAINDFFSSEEKFLISPTPGHKNCAPKIRYLAAMLEYPLSPSTTIYRAVATGPYTGNNQKDTRYGIAFEKGPSAPKCGRPGSITRISAEVNKVLDKYGILDLFMKLINSYGNVSQRVKFLDKLYEIYTKYGFDKQEAELNKTGVPLDFKVKSESEVKKYHRDERNVGQTTFWYVIDENYIERSENAWEKFVPAPDIVEQEDEYDEWVAAKEQWEWDCKVNMYILTSKKYGFVNNPKEKPFTTGNGLPTNFKKEVDKKIEDDFTNNNDDSWDEIADNDFNDYDKDVRDATNLDESIFKSIYRKNLKKKLFEKIYVNAKK